jgi:hypothetical protein
MDFVVSGGDCRSEKISKKNQISGQSFLSRHYFVLLAEHE